MIDDSYFEEDTYQTNNTVNIKKIIYIVLAAIFLIVIIVILFSAFKNKNSGYSKYENDLIVASKKYITENQVNTYNEIYLDSSLLKVSIPDNCSISSGVIYNNGDYKPYLLCDDYESKVLKNSNTNIKLNGKEVMLLPRGMTFTDPGYSSNQKVKVTSLVGKEVGVYNVYYALDGSDDVVIRKVIIVDNPGLLNYYPIMSLNGNELETLKVNEIYQDRGAVAMDKQDGNITNKIKTEGMVNTSIAGEYTILYSVSNSRGYTNSLKRQVIVTEDNDDLVVLLGLSDDTLTNESVNIIVNIIGTNYQYTVLPNEEQTTEKGFNYKVDSNGIYKFRIYDNLGNYIEKAIEVLNIVKEIPIGSCVATLYNDRTEIYVNISSSNTISSYRYKIDGMTSSYQFSNSYRTSATSSNNISVDVRDIIGNENTIKCTISNQKFSITTPGKTITYDVNGIRRTLKGEPLRTKLTKVLSAKGYTIDQLNACIVNKVKQAGIGTRYGVVEAGVGLIDCMKSFTGYVISYDHWGGKVDQDALNNKLGVNPRWGTATEGNSSSCASSSCYLGLDCASFVRWALCNGGMNFCYQNYNTAEKFANKAFPEANSFRIARKKVIHNYGTNLTGYSMSQLLGMLKPGDVIYTPKKNVDGQSHVVLVIGIETNAIYIAENGSTLRKINFNEFMRSDSDNTFFLLDRFYANSANRHNLYN